MHARKNALAADVVVVNHHLFFADVVLRDEGVAELLPACNTVIFDEAHQLPETARLFFGETVSTAQLVELARDARLEAARRGRRLAGARPRGVDWTRRRATCACASRKDGRAPAAGRRRCAKPDSRTRLQALAQALDALRKPLAAQAERSEGLGACARARRRGARRCSRASASEGTKNEVRWVEVFDQSLQLHVTPLVVGRAVPQADGRTIRAPGSSPRRRWRWARTSRTTSSELGLEDAADARAGRARSISRARRCCTSPQGLPAEPNDPGYTEAVVEAALPVLRGEPRPRLPAVHACARCARCAARTSCCADRHRLSAAGAGRRLAQRAAGALPRSSATRCCSAQPVVLGGRGRARRGAVGGA